MALSAINTNAYWPLRGQGIVRVIEFAGATSANSEGFLITGATNIIVQVMGSFGSATVTFKKCADNSTYVALTTAVISFTAAGVKAVSPTDVASQFYRFEYTGGSATDTALTCIVVALGASDIV